MSNTLASDFEHDTLPFDPTSIARQAILNADRAVFGYELFDRSLPANGHTAASDAALLFNVLSHADTDALLGRKTIFINCTHETLAGGHLALIPPDRVVLEIPPLPAPSAEEIEIHLQNLTDISKRGFRLSFNYTVLTNAYASWLPLASFIKIDLSQLNAGAVGSIVQLVQKKSTARLIAEKVETAEQYALISGLGIKLYQGYWFARPVLISGQSIRPAQAAIIQLINLVRIQADTFQIEDVLKKDPTLSFNLLRFINSAGFGLNSKITSFRHAVMILGLKKLFRWAALLLATSHINSASPAVGSLAVVRGRLMELLAADLLAPDECDNAFVVGVFSLLDTMLGIPMAQALESISLPENVVDALLYNTGALAPFLALAKACESADDAAFAHNAELLKLTNQQVNWAHLQALSWAETLTV
jgi:EAL and modified HD-GYP domain-containing signal transduction protein